MYVFQEGIKKIEKTNISIIEVLECLREVRQSLQSRAEENFLTLKVKEIFRKYVEEGKENEVFVAKKNCLFFMKNV